MSAESQQAFIDALFREIEAAAKRFEAFRGKPADQTTRLGIVSGAIFEALARQSEQIRDLKTDKVNMTIALGETRAMIDRLEAKLAERIDADAAEFGRQIASLKEAYVVPIGQDDPHDLTLGELVECEELSDTAGRGL